MIQNAPEIINRAKFVAYLHEPQIIVFHFKKDMDVNSSDMRECFEAHDLLKVGPNIKRIIISGKHGSISPEARELAQKESRPASAEAFVIGSLAQKIVFNLFIKLRKMKHPMRAFDSFEKALEWINTK